MREKTLENLAMGYSAAYHMRAERARKLLVVVVGAVASLFTGCVQLELSSAADCDENSKMRFCDVGSAYGFDWGKNAQYMLDRCLQDNAGKVDERAIQRLIVSRTWWEVLAAYGSFGIVMPLEYTVWLEAKE
jgi:hypothetical protein